MTSPAFHSLGVPPPRKTFLEGRTPRQPTSARSTHSSHHGHGGLGSIDTKAVILNEHKVELMDMLHESVAMLKNVYRSKFVFGDHLRYVDPSYGGDSVNEFNLASPPSFDASYVPPPPLTPPAGGPSAQAVAGEDTAQKEKLRTAEELIKKLYRRNTHLETENKYLRGELQRLERFQGLGRTESHNLTMMDGHLPLEHPLYSRKLRRNCRSCPPSRTLVRAAVSGHGLAFPPRGGAREEAPPKEDPLPVAQLKHRVSQLTEALVAVQHENEKLAREKADRVSLRDTLLRNYIVERDTQIANLHRGLQELLNKVANPMKLTRAKQPANSINPVVATNNVLKDISARLSDQINNITGDIVKKSAAAAPDATSGVSAAAGAASLPPHRRSSIGADVSPTRQGERTTSVAGENAQQGRRKELVRRIRTVVETLPLQKRKQIVLLLTELKQLFDGVTHSNRALLAAYEQHKQKSNQDIVQLKLEVAMLRDELRAVDPNNRQSARASGQAGAARDVEDP